MRFVMNISHSTSTLRLDTLDWKQIERQLQRSRDRQEDSTEDSGRRLCCAACRRPITREDQRIRVQSRHEHVFSNPLGLTFRIGCFAVASGCVYFGEATEEWTWFPGYRWQVSVCGGCGSHLGWRYMGRDGDGFHGFILRHLIPEQDPG
jgi:hypothetical protein